MAYLLKTQEQRSQYLLRICTTRLVPLALRFQTELLKVLTNNPLMLKACVLATFTTVILYIDQQCYVISDSAKSLLHCPAIEKLNLLVKSTSYIDMCITRTAIFSLFTGLEKLQCLYTIKLSETAKPFCALLSSFTMHGHCQTRVKQHGTITSNLCGSDPNTQKCL